MGNRTVRPRRSWAPGLVVLALIVAVAVVAAVLLSSRHRNPAARKGGSAPSSVTLRITSVSPFMLNGRPPDDPHGLALTIDGNSATFWQSDQYRDATFDNLYPGMGLAIELSSSGDLHHLVVSSSTTGWAAQAYVASSAVPEGQSVSAWGRPTDTQTGISGSTTFDLHGHRGQWVLLWLTRLGDAGSYFQTRIAELSVN